MPVEFLTDAQAQRYGRFAGDPSAAQLARYFHLDDADRSLVELRRSDANRLGFAVQLCTVRFLGTFLADPTDVPPDVVTYVSRQLRIDPTCLPHYRDHAREIQRRYGYQDFHALPAYGRLARWLYLRAWVSDERPSLLFDLATAHLVERKILLPGVTVLARLVARVRERVAQRLWRVLAALPDAQQRTRLEGLLVAPAGGRYSHLDRLRRGPTRIGSTALVKAVRRLEAIRALGISELSLARVPPNRLNTLGRYAASVWAPTIARMPDDRRTATLLAFARTIETTALDDTIDVLDLLLSDILAEATQHGQQARLRTVRDLDEAALRLRQACAILLDETYADVQVRPTVFTHVPRAQLTDAVAQVGALARPPDDHYYPELVEQYQRVRRFLPTLLRAIVFHSMPTGQPVLDALQFLAALDARRPPPLRDAPRDVVPRPWRRLVLGLDTTIDRRAYTLCVMERLQDTHGHGRLCWVSLCVGSPRLYGPANHGGLRVVSAMIAPGEQT